MMATTTRLLIRSLPFVDWPAADRAAWDKACRPGVRLRRGGSASHLKEVSREDLGRRYGMFLDYLVRAGRFLTSLAAGELVTPENVASYLEELQGRVGSVTVYGSISKLRRMVSLLDPGRDLAWLSDIEKDLDLAKVARSKYPRLFSSATLAEIGLTLAQEAEVLPPKPLYRSLRKESRAAIRRAKGKAIRADLNRAVLSRNGVLLSLLAFCPIRRKNIAALEIGKQLRRIGDEWWIVLTSEETKNGRADERPVPDILKPYIERYLANHRSVLGRGRLDSETGPMWISSQTGSPAPISSVERSIRKSTAVVLGIEVGPHMFRTAAATSAASLAPKTPRLASGVLGHVDVRVTEEHYNRAKAHEAGQALANVLRDLDPV